MAQLNLHPAFRSFRGAMGNMVFKKRGQKSFVSSKAQPNLKEPTEEQQEVRERFSMASSYAKSVLANPQTKALYEAAAKSREVPARAVAMKDFLKEPVVTQVDLSSYSRQAGDKILVSAIDDFEVMAVEVTIKNGQVIESGAAVKSEELGRWVYTATTTVALGAALTIDATATDRPGNKGVKSETLN